MWPDIQHNRDSIKQSMQQQSEHCRAGCVRYCRDRSLLIKHVCTKCSAEMFNTPPSVSLSFTVHQRPVLLHILSPALTAKLTLHWYNGILMVGRSLMKSRLLVPEGTWQDVTPLEPSAMCTTYCAAMCTPLACLQLITNAAWKDTQSYSCVQVRQLSDPNPDANMWHWRFLP